MWRWYPLEMCFSRNQGFYRWQTKPHQGISVTEIIVYINEMSNDATLVKTLDFFLSTFYSQALRKRTTGVQVQVIRAGEETRDLLTHDRPVWTPERSVPNWGTYVPQVRIPCDCWTPANRWGRWLAAICEETREV